MHSLIKIHAQFLDHWPVDIIYETLHDIVNYLEAYNLIFFSKVFFSNIVELNLVLVLGVNIKSDKLQAFFYFIWAHKCALGYERVN